ncbi:MAG: glutaredoxin family protein [Gammaproteobacteria bacterium]
MNTPLTLYYRHNCHLCEQMLAELRAICGDGLQLSLVDVDSDAVLKQRYGLRVPVLMGGATILSLGKLDRSSLEDYLETR